MMKIYKVGRILRAYYPAETGIKEYLAYMNKEIQTGDAVVIAHTGSGHSMEKIGLAMKIAVDRARKEGYIPVLVACGCAGGTLIEFAKQAKVIAIAHQDFRDWADKSNPEETDDLIGFLQSKINSTENSSKGCGKVYYHFPKGE